SVAAGQHAEAEPVDQSPNALKVGIVRHVLSFQDESRRHNPQTGDGFRKIPGNMWGGAPLKFRQRGSYSPAAFKPGARGRNPGFYRPSRYHMAPSASSKTPRPRKPPNKGTRMTDLRTLSSVVRRPIQSRPDAAPEERTGTMEGRETACPAPGESCEGASRRTLPPVTSAAGFSFSWVETTSANSGALTGPT